MSTLITDIGELATCSPGYGEGPLGALTRAALVIDGGVVAWVGAAGEAPAADEVFDAAGRAVLPGFVDSHAHLVFAGERSAEFAARMSPSEHSRAERDEWGGGGERGRQYAAGGIRATVAATRQADDSALRATASRYVSEMRRQGTTTVECKSGYGLTVDDEVRALRIAGEVADEVTYLGGHVVPPEYADDPGSYVALVAGDMLDACAPYARWIDVFCEEKGAFGGDATREILTAGVRHGLVPRLHANQLGAGPGVRIAVEFGAASADHCTHLTDDDIAALAGSGTVATLLPGVEFSTRSPYPPARRLIEAGATVALATDCNPGSCFTSSMGFCIALAVREMGMTTQEAVWAATAGGALALRRDDIGHLAPGARADLQVLDAPSHIHLAYRPGVPLTAEVWRGGVRL